MFIWNLDRDPTNTQTCQKDSMDWPIHLRCQLCQTTNKFVVRPQLLDMDSSCRAPIRWGQLDGMRWVKTPLHQFAEAATTTRRRNRGARHEQHRAAAEWRKGDTSQPHGKENKRKQDTTRTTRRKGRRVGEKQARAAKGNTQQTKVKHEQLHNVPIK